MFRFLSVFGYIEQPVYYRVESRPLRVGALYQVRRFVVYKSYFFEP